MRNKRHFLFATFLVVLLLLNMNSLRANAYNGSVIVYVTETGEKYHRDGCTYLKSKIPMTLERASERYGRCSRCDPPILGSDKPNDAEPYLSDWDASYSGDSEPIETETVEVEISSPKENEDSESSFYIKIFFPVPLIILLYFLIKSCIKRRTQIELHKARCRGELPGGVPGMPFGTIIGEDGLPREIDSKYAWGNRYTFYISQKGEVFHSNPWCSNGTLIAVHAIYLGRRRPCKKCRPVKPDLSWFIPYFQKWKENTGKTKSLEAKKGESYKPKTIIRESKSKTYSKVIQTGVDENGNKIWTAFFADTPEELRRKTDEREYKGE